MSQSSPISPERVDRLLATVAELDLSEPTAAMAHLEAVFPLRGSMVQDLRETLERAAATGEICDRGAPPVMFSRLWKASDNPHGVSADCVLMTGPGPRHNHPNGEVNLAFRVDGEPRFDGHPEGWIVKSPGSTHVPTVEGGEMFILYLLPGGAIEFL